MADDSKIGLQSEIDNKGLKSGSKEYNKTVDDMVKKTQDGAKKVNDAFEDMNKTFVDANGRLRNANGSFAAMGGSASGAASGIKSLGGSFNSLNLPSLTTGLSGIGTSILNIGLTATKALGGVTALGIGMVTAFGVSGVKAAMDVDHQLAQIAATLGTTKDAAMPLKTLMTDLALDPGLTVNATQAGQAIEMLAANGLELEQILDGAAKGTVQLANATGSDFTVAATIATDAMAQFGIDAKDLSTVADGISGVLIQTKFSAEDYSLALSNAGGIAAQLGVDYSDFNTVLAATASNFSSGSDAGTSFKTLLTRLSDPTDEVKDAMQQYGISIFDAEGKMKPFAEIAGQLNKVFNENITLTTQVGGATDKQAKAAENASSKIGDLARDIGVQETQLKNLTDTYNESLKYHDASEMGMKNQALAIQKLTNNITDNKEKLGEYQGAIDLVNNAQTETITTTKKLTEEEKAKLATILGGTDAMRTVLGLAEMTEDEFRTLSGEVNKNGLAAESAATRVDSLKGAWEIFKGIIEAIQIQLGDKFLPIIRSVTEAFSKFASENSSKVVDAFGLIATGIDNFINKGKLLFSIFQSEGTGGLVAALGLTPQTLELISKMTTLFTDLGSTITSSFSGLGEFSFLDTINTSIEFVNRHFEEFKGILLGVGAVLAGGVFVALVAGVMSLLTPINLIIAAAGLLGAAWMGNWGNIQGIVGSVVAYLTEQFTTLSTLVQPAITSIQQSFGQLTATFGSGKGLLDSFLVGLSAIGTFIVSTLIPAWVQWIGFLSGVAASAFSLWVQYIQTAYGAFQSLSSFIQSDVVPVFLSMNDGISLIVDVMASLGNLLNAVVGKALEAMAGIWKNILQPALVQVGNSLRDNIMPYFTSLGATVKSDVSPVLKDLGEVVFPILNEGIEMVIQAIKDMIGYFNSMADTVASFSLPDILTPGSPPPMAYALMDIAGGAQQATNAIAGMQQGMLGSAASADRFIDSLNMGGFAANSMLSNWNDVRDILKLNISGNMGRLASGELSGADLPRILGEQARAWNVPPQMLQGIAEAQGLFSHFSDTFLAFQKQIRIENLGNMMQMAGSWSSAGSTLADMLQKQMGNMEGAKKATDKYHDSNKKLNDGNIKLTDTLLEQEEKLSILNRELSELTTNENQDLIAIDKKKIAIRELTEEMDKNRLSIEKNNQAIIDSKKEFNELAKGDNAERMAFLKEFLDSGKESITLADEMLHGAFEGQMSYIFWDKVSAQEEYNRLLEEQKRKEELITRQKEAQEKLDKLKVQLDLLKLGQSLGGDIFSGMKFGLDASVEDLLAATNAVTMALVDQINSDLQIASPSKVLMKKGLQAGQGLALGIEKSKGMLQSAMGRVGNKLVSSSSTIYNSNNYNFGNMNFGGNSSGNPQLNGMMFRKYVRQNI
jgi:TP901 family phage tail tape measure protein